MPRMFSYVEALTPSHVVRYQLVLVTSLRFPRHTPLTSRHDVMNRQAGRTPVDAEAQAELQAMTQHLARAIVPQSQVRSRS